MRVIEEVTQVKKCLTVISAVSFLTASTLAFAHPHFNKTINCTLPGGAEVTIAYNTTPANMEHAESADVGAFITPRGPRLTVSQDIAVGGVTIPAGTHTIGVIKNGANDWVMGLYKGGLERGTQPDMANVIKLDSVYSSSAGTADHMLIDVTPGHGKFEGKAVLTLHFGTMFLSGALS